MSFDFQEIKVVNMLKDFKLSQLEFKGVPDHEGKMWPFGSTQATAAMEEREKSSQARVAEKRRLRLSRQE